MNASLTLEEVLRLHRQAAAVLRAHGQPAQADSMTRVADDVAMSLGEFLTWLSETEATLYTGWSKDRLRRAFPGWEARQLAEKRSGQRYYRRACLQHRLSEQSTLYRKAG